jgi:hypothetical protein
MNEIAHKSSGIEIKIQTYLFNIIKYFLNPNYRFCKPKY